MKKPITIILTLLFTSFAALNAAEASQRPNILYIFTDDQSYRSVSAYEGAHDWVKTPNIDALAKSGMRFKPAIQGHPVKCRGR